MAKAPQSKKPLDPKALSDWYEKVHRKLPWRETQDPYRIWISEVMLQQTQVATVIPYYQRFLASFPNLKTLAEAPQEKVLSHWAGLGYYSRARNLQKGAQVLLTTHSGNFPQTREEILKVPGIGPYTAGAVLSIAFDLPVPLVDGNVQRVFSRFYGIEEPLESKVAQTKFWEKADELVHQAKSPRIFNQALMELGATVCTKGQPACAQCPLKENCFAKATERQLKFPHRKPRRKTQDLYWIALIYQQKDRFYVRKNAADEWWHGLWDFPHEAHPCEAAIETRIQELEKKYGALKPLQRQKHTVTHHRIHLRPYQIALSKPPKLDGRWVDFDELKSLPISSLARKVVSELDP